MVRADEERLLDTFAINEGRLTKAFEDAKQASGRTTPAIFMMVLALMRLEE
jgi:hypothetical protein